MMVGTQNRIVDRVKNKFFNRLIILLVTAEAIYIARYLLGPLRCSMVGPMAFRE